jgi:hypothetical protein
MKYLLGIGLIVEKYKKDPIIRVSIDNTLIDEFAVDNFPLHQKELVCYPSKQWIGDKKQSLKLGHTTKYADHSINIIRSGTSKGELRLPNRGLEFPRNFKTYLIDGRVLENSKEIVLDVKNDDSNYTNGFMTKSTLIHLKHIFLIPIDQCKFFVESNKHTHNNFLQIVPSHYGRNVHIVNDHEVQDVNKNIYERGIEGYPFSFKQFWNGREVGEDRWFGGTGRLSVQLITNQHDTVSCNTYDSKYLRYYNDPLCNVDGFLVSGKFFAMAYQGLFDKYLYENQ